MRIGLKSYMSAGFASEMEILMHLRSLKRVRGEVSLYDPIGVDREGNEITLVDVSKTTQPSSRRAAAKAFLSMTVSSPAPIILAPRSRQWRASAGVPA